MLLLLEEWKAFLGEAKREEWDSAHVVILKENKVLLVQRSNNDQWMAGKWAFPGGQLDAGETLEVALKREVKEEVGLDIDLSDLSYLPSISYKIKHAFFACNKSSGKAEINANGVHEHEEYKWVTKSEINNMDTVPDLKEVVNEAFKILGVK